jgi:uncharacterized protein
MAGSRRRASMESMSGTLMRIFVDEGDRSGQQPLYMRIVEELQKGGFPGATVFKGIEGYGAHKQIHSARVFDLSANLPVLIEVVDSEERVRGFIPRLRELIPEGLITLEKVEMIAIRKA